MGCSGRFGAVDVDELRSGDLIGVSAANSDLGQAIAASGQTPEYDHLGLMERQGGDVLVWNANPELGVIAERLPDFISRETARESRQFHIYRFNTEVNAEAVLDYVRRQNRLPYNHSFRQSDNAFYCADLIARAFPPGFFTPKPMQFNGDYWDAYYRKLGISVPHGELGFHPADMLTQDNLNYLGELNLLGQ